MRNIHEEGGKKRMVQEVSIRHKEVNRENETKQVEDLRTVLQSPVLEIDECVIKASK